MAAQSEREPGVIDMGEGLLDPMAQDEEVEQEMLDVEEEQFFPPQIDPEPEMGAAAAEAAVYDTSPPPLYPPILAESAQPGTVDMAQLFAMLAGISGDIHGMNERMEANTKGMNETREEIKKQRERNERRNKKNAG